MISSNLSRKSGHRNQATDALKPVDKYEDYKNSQNIEKR
jgi:hypothetical protein